MLKESARSVGVIGPLKPTRTWVGFKGLCSNGLRRRFGCTVRRSCWAKPVHSFIRLISTGQTIFSHPEASQSAVTINHTTTESWLRKPTLNPSQLVLIPASKGLDVVPSSYFRAKPSQWQFNYGKATCDPAGPTYYQGILELYRGWRRRSGNGASIDFMLRQTLII